MTTLWRPSETRSHRHHVMTILAQGLAPGLIPGSFGLACRTSRPCVSAGAPPSAASWHVRGSDSGRILLTPGEVALGRAMVAQGLVRQAARLGSPARRPRPARACARAVEHARVCAALLNKRSVGAALPPPGVARVWQMFGQIQPNLAQFRPKSGHIWQIPGPDLVEIGRTLSDIA